MGRGLNFRVNLCPGTETSIENAQVFKFFQRTQIVIDVCRLLADGRFPFKAQPRQVFKNTVDVIWTAAPKVYVFDTKKKPPPRTLSGPESEQGGMRVAQV